jgi:hypothetical protein
MHYIFKAKKFILASLNISNFGAFPGILEYLVGHLHCQIPDDELDKSSTACFLHLDVWASPRAVCRAVFELGAAVHYVLSHAAPLLDTPHPALTRRPLYLATPHLSWTRRTPL